MKFAIRIFLIPRCKVSDTHYLPVQYVRFSLPLIYFLPNLIMHKKFTRALKNVFLIVAAGF